MNNNRLKRDADNASDIIDGIIGDLVYEIEEAIS